MLVMFYTMSKCFPKQHSRLGGNVKFELDLFNYATKSDVKKQQVFIHHRLPRTI